MPDRCGWLVTYAFWSTTCGWWQYHMVVTESDPVDYVCSLQSDGAHYVLVNAWPLDNEQYERAYEVYG